MSKNNSSADNNCSHNPLTSYGWRVPKDNTLCGYSAESTKDSTRVYESATQSFDDNNELAEEDKKTTHTYNFISSDQIARDKTTQDYIPTAPVYDITNSRAKFNYTKNDVPILECPIDKENAKIREYDTQAAPPRIHRYKQIMPHVNNNLQMRRSEQQTSDRDCLPVYLILAVSIFCVTIFGGIILIGRYNARHYHENSTS
ncbi:hypothetical protein TSAR_001965 [Trichomalopsis sarcophagae]|uniref:Uncharacterized protein n=1 Tax=Trichomalopsis sarcophagae TaxID=543379 RepID=A0A232EHI6_9HYME|nr:hypothetical protein TSAR_001965 [Trichomalopsis sarcophagae]